MASQLLDYNQVTEQSANTGDAIPSSGGLLTWNFRADPNLAWDPSQTFFVMRVALKNGNDCKVRNMVDHWPLRLFSSMTHIVDGVTIASTQNPWADKFFQQRYLTENTVANGQNLQTQLTQSGIFINLPASGLDAADDPNLDALDLSSYSAFKSSTGEIYTTVIFQPPFDFWTKHQRCSGGNHQIQLNLRPSKQSADLNSVSTPSWGDYCVPYLVGETFKNNTDGGQTHQQGDVVDVWIDRIRLCRRMVRFNIERPLQIQEFNLTEMQFFHGTAVTLSQSTAAAQYATTSGTEQSQNFILPSSTFGIALYWRHANDSQYAPLGPQGPFGDTNGFAKTDAPTLQDFHNTVELEDLYFSYGGETYPAQRIENIGKHQRDSPAPGVHQLQLLSHQLQGVFNMPMEFVQTSFLAQRGIRSLGDKLLYFPVAKHNNSDNSDLQVYYKARLQKQSATVSGGSVRTVPINLVVVAFYDARAEFSYNSMNQLEKVTKTEWK